MVAYFLSILAHTIEQGIVEYVFLDELLFVVSTKITWFDNITNYLAIDKIPYHFSYQEHAKIVRQGANYSWMQGYLFKQGLNHILKIFIR